MAITKLHFYILAAFLSWPLLSMNIYEVNNQKRRVPNYTASYNPKKIKCDWEGTAPNPAKYGENAREALLLNLTENIEEGVFHLKSDIEKFLDEELKNPNNPNKPYSLKNVLDITVSRDLSQRYCLPLNDQGTQVGMQKLYFDYGGSLEGTPTYYVSPYGNGECGDTFQKDVVSIIVGALGGKKREPLFVFTSGEFDDDKGGNLLSIIRILLREKFQTIFEKPYSSESVQDLERTLFNSFILGSLKESQRPKTLTPSRLLDLLDRNG